MEESRFKNRVFSKCRGFENKRLKLKLRPEMKKKKKRKETKKQRDYNNGGELKIEIYDVGIEI